MPALSLISTDDPNSIRRGGERRACQPKARRSSESAMAAEVLMNHAGSFRGNGPGHVSWPCGAQVVKPHAMTTVHMRQVQLWTIANPGDIHQKLRGAGYRFRSEEPARPG